MAQLQITIDLDNAVFDESDGFASAESEVGRILSRIADRFDEAKTSGHWLNAHDLYGNPVAKFKVDPDAELSFS